jgi:hypothetical protein
MRGRLGITCMNEYQRDRLKKYTLGSPHYQDVLHYLIRMFPSWRRLNNGEDRLRKEVFMTEGK